MGRIKAIFAKRKILLIIVICFVAILLGFLGLILAMSQGYLLFGKYSIATKEVVYTQDYAEVLGITNYSAHTYKYSQMIKDFGEPKKVVIDNEIKQAIYDSMIFSCSKAFNFEDVGDVTVLDAKYKFGDKKVGIGSSKAEIIKAYRGVRGGFDAKYNCASYSDGAYNEIIYRFDASGTVNRVDICLGI